MVALFQRRSTQPVPHILSIHRPSHLRSNLQVAALDRQVESGLRILNKVQGNLGVPLLLQIANDALTDKVATSNDLKNLVVVLPDQGELESVFGRVDGDCFWLCGSVQAVYDLSLDSSQVDWLLERLDNPVVPEL